MNTKFLNNINFSIYGESHGQSIGVIIDNIPSGFEIDFKIIEQKLKNRKPQTKYNTKRFDSDTIIIESGILNAQTTGTPLCIILKNDDVKTENYKKKEFRFNHADYVNYLKFGDNYAYGGGGPFSGRLTAIVVVVGAIYEQLLKTEIQNMEIYGQIKQIANIESKSLNTYTLEELKNHKEKIASEKLLPIFDYNARKKSEHFLTNIEQENDSIGALIEFRIINVPAKLGGLYFDSFESKLSHALFSIPGVKGINFGSGIEHYLKKGSQMQEDISIINNKIVSHSNISGGINGGITNGYQDVVFTCIVKAPTALNQEQTIGVKVNDKYKLKNQKIEGRHDRIIANKVIFVVEAWINIVISDCLIENSKGETWKNLPVK